MRSVQNQSAEPARGEAKPYPFSTFGIRNEDIARGFDEIADILELQNENAFRIRAYRNAARTFRGLGEDVSQILARGDRLDDLPGIGADLAHQISAMVQSGRLAQLEELRPKVSPVALALCRLPGLGPKRAIVLTRELKPTPKTLADVLSACNSGRVRQLRGFGVRSEKALLENLKRNLMTPTRYKIAVARRQADAILAHLQTCPEVLSAEVAGSCRRSQETVGDLDVVCASTDAPAVMKHFLATPGRDRILAQGQTKASIDMADGMQVDLRVVLPESFGAALVYFTGSKAHNIALRRLAQARGLKINEYGVFRKSQRIAGETEASVYASLDLPFIEPELREDHGEMAAAMARKLPVLVTRADLKGDLHVHAIGHDGTDDLQSMAMAARARGHSYIAITDHSRSLSAGRGLTIAGLHRRIAEIDKINAQHPGIALLRGVEVEILRDGSLDLPDAVLRELDIVVAVIHSHFDLPRAEQTARIVRAISHPSVTILAHPTGRLLLEGRTYDFEMGAIVAAAKAHGCWLEINSSPDRLDLDHIQCRFAKEAGVKLTISSGAHHPDDLDDLVFGVGEARRGWIEPDDVVNTRSLPALRLLLARKARQREPAQ